MRSATRRTVLSRAASATPAVVLAAGSAVALAAGPDPHPAWVARLVAMHEFERTVKGCTDEEVSAFTDEMTELESLVAATPSTSVAGALAQVRSALILLDDGGSINLDRDTDALRHALATLERLWPEAAHA